MPKNAQISAPEEQDLSPGSKSSCDSSGTNKETDKCRDSCELPTNVTSNDDLSNKEIVNSNCELRSSQFVDPLEGVAPVINRTASASSNTNTLMSDKDSPSFADIDSKTDFVKSNAIVINETTQQVCFSSSGNTVAAQAVSTPKAAQCQTVNAVAETLPAQDGACVQAGRSHYSAAAGMLSSWSSTSSVATRTNTDAASSMSAVVTNFGVTAVGSEEGKGAGGSNSQANNIKTKNCQGFKSTPV